MFLGKPITYVSSSELTDNTGKGIFRFNYIESHSNIDQNGDLIADNRYPIVNVLRITSNLQDPYPTVIRNPAEIHFHPPSVITSPKDGSTLNGSTPISWFQDISYDDPNISFTVEIQRIGETMWRAIARDVFNQSILWDIADVENGNYQMRIISNDTHGFPFLSAFINHFVDNNGFYNSFENEKTN